LPQTLPGHSPGDHARDNYPVTGGPDAAGSNEYLETFLSLSSQYAEAKLYLSRLNTQTEVARPVRGNHRLTFFRQLDVIESLELPYAWHQDENRDALGAARRAARDALRHWKADWIELYQDADQELVRIKQQRPRGPYLKHALALNIRPLMHDLIGFHLTGRDLYAKQARQNLAGIMHQLNVNGCLRLQQFLSCLIEDTNEGPAVLD